MDAHTRAIAVSGVEWVLNNCMRTYERQFSTRSEVCRNIQLRFDSLLHGYFEHGEAKGQGLPCVQYFADQLGLSANYLGDVIRRESGESAQNLIQNKLIEQAKGLLEETTLTVAEIAYNLGFTYPQHFNRTFRRATGCTPMQFRKTGGK